MSWGAAGTYQGGRKDSWVVDDAHWVVCGAGGRQWLLVVGVEGNLLKRGGRRRWPLVEGVEGNPRKTSGGYQLPRAMA